MSYSWKSIRARVLGAEANFDRDLQQEIEAHLQIEIDQNLAAGMSPEAARCAAMTTFGNVSRASERSRAAWSFRRLDELAHDLRFAVRMLIKDPGFSAAAALTLALGIGANAAMFSVINAVLLKSLPYPDPSHLVVLDEYKIEHGSRTVSWLDFEDWKKQDRSFSSMAAYRLAHFTLTGDGEPSLLRAGEISSTFFGLLGVQPALGRDFTATDDQPGANRTAIVSYTFWNNVLRGAPDISGKTLDLDGFSYSVIGVLPRDFNFFDKSADIYLPVGLNGKDPVWNRRGFHPDLLVLARLRPGVSIDAARSEMGTIMGRLDQEYPHSNAGMLASVTPLHEFRFGKIQPVLFTLFAAVGCVLLIGTVNVANLSLARGSSRSKELAIRVALGAGAGRLIRQMLTESLLLSLVGAAAGLLLAYGGLRAILQFAPQSIPQIGATEIDARVILFAVLISILTGILVAIVPAFQAARVDMNAAFKENSRGFSSGRSGKRLRSSLLICETAFALILIMASGLLIRSLVNASEANPGFRADHTLALDVMLPPTKYDSADRQSVFFTQAVQRLAAVPGVESAGAAYCPPLVGVCASNAFTLADQPVASVADLPTAASNIVVPGYLPTLKVPLLSGRFFTESDNQHSHLVAIVNQSFAHRWWPHADAVGKLLREGGPERNEPYREIVGVVGDVKQDGMDGIQQPEVFFPVTQFPFAPWDSLQAMTFVLRTKGDPMALAGAAKKAVWTVDQDLPLTAVQSLEDYRAESLGRREFSTILLGIFGLLALILAAVGTYGVMAYNVNQQRHEIGTRMALGARSRDIRNVVLGEAALLTVKALVIGSLGTWACARWMRGLLFGVKASDPVTFAMVCAVLGIVALIASYVPMRRAMRIDPAAALRSE